MTVATPRWQRARSGSDDSSDLEAASRRSVNGHDSCLDYNIATFSRWFGRYGWWPVGGIMLVVVVVGLVSRGHTGDDSPVTSSPEPPPQSSCHLDVFVMSLCPDAYACMKLVHQKPAAASTKRLHAIGGGPNRDQPHACMHR
jgi:hypothetical protein